MPGTAWPPVHTIKQAAGVYDVGPVQVNMTPAALKTTSTCGPTCLDSCNAVAYMLNARNVGSTYSRAAVSCYRKGVFHFMVIAD